MSKLKGILLTEGMHGMLSQVEGLAKALDIEFTHHKVELNNLWKLIPSKFTPISQSVYKKINHSDYDLIISCGRKSIIPSIHLKSISNKKVLNIHIQDPLVDFNHFDFIVAPEHDGISGPNVIKTKGAIHYLTENEIEENRSYLNLHIKQDNRKVWCLIMGGPTKYYNYSTKNIKSIFSKIKNLIEKNNLNLIVIPSNRTPKETVSLAKSELVKDTTIIETVDKKAYLSALCLAKYIVVTCDSSSMISEAALTGKPVYVAMIETNRNDKRFQDFRKLFENMNILRKLDDKLETWSYEKLDEANRIAKLIKLK